MMRRIASHLVCGVSVILFLLTIGIWVRSYCFVEKGYGYIGNNLMGIQWLFGRVTISCVPGMDTRSGTSWRSFRTQNWSESLLEVLRKGEVLGFRYQAQPFYDGQSSRPSTIHSLRMPHWFLAVVFACYPLLCVKRFIRKKRDASKGLCKQCGYDLRATPDRCPECGTESVPSPGVPGEG